jgi:hypothetical protein
MRRGWRIIAVTSIALLAACKRGDKGKQPTELVLVAESNDTAEPATVCAAPPETVATCRNPTDKLRIAADSYGVFHLTWVDINGLHQRIMYATRANGVWGTPEMLLDIGDAIGGVESLALLLGPRDQPRILAFVDRSRGQRPRDAGVEFHLLRRESAWVHEQKAAHNAYALAPIAASIDEDDRLHVIWDTPAIYDRMNHGDNASDEFLYSTREPDGRWAWEVPVPHDDFTMARPAIVATKGRVDVIASSGERTKTIMRGMTRTGTTWGPLTGRLADGDLRIIPGAPFLAIPTFTDRKNELPLFGGGPDHLEPLGKVVFPSLSGYATSVEAAWGGKTPIVSLVRDKTMVLAAPFADGTRELKLGPSEKPAQIAVAGATLYAVWPVWQVSAQNLLGCEVPLRDRRWHLITH